MKTELLLQFIVPLTFLAIWALTSLLNRDAQPLPPRPGRAPGAGGGPRPGMGAPLVGRGEPAGSSRSQGASRPAAPAAERSAPARWAAPPAQARSLEAGRSGGPDEGIVILESETRTSQGSTSSFSPSSAATARAARSTASRRSAARGRAPQAASPKSIESERPRVLTGLVSQPLGPKKGRTLEIVPLSTPITPLGSPLTQQTTPNLPHATTNKPRPTLTSSDLRTMLASPAKLREIALLGELLQPPVALRGSPAAAMNAASVLESRVPVGNGSAADAWSGRAGVAERSDRNAATDGSTRLSAEEAASSEPM